MPRWTDSGSDARCASSASGVVGDSSTSPTGAGLSRSVVDRIELGQSGRVALEDLENLARALDGQLGLDFRWRGEQLDRLIDERHTAIVDRAVAIYRDARWDVAVEATFSIFGERGSIDVFAHHPVADVVAVNEIKASIGEAGNTVHRRRPQGQARSADRGVAGMAVPRRRPIPDRRRGIDVARPGQRGTPDTFRTAFPAATAGVPRMDPRPGRPTAERDPLPRAPEWASGELAQRDRVARSGVQVDAHAHTACGPRPGSPECTPRDRAGPGAAGAEQRRAHSGRRDPAAPAHVAPRLGLPFRGQWESGTSASRSPGPAGQPTARPATPHVRSVRGPGVEWPDACPARRAEVRRLEPRRRGPDSARREADRARAVGRRGPRRRRVRDGRRDRRAPEPRRRDHRHARRARARHAPRDRRAPERDARVDGAPRARRQGDQPQRAAGRHHDRRPLRQGPDRVASSRPA